MKVRLLIVALVLTALLLPLSASARPPEAAAATSTFTYTKNMKPMGYSPFPSSPGNPFTANSDLAFWEDYAIQGHYLGFRIVDISSPANPEQISFTECRGNQGDVIVWDNIVVRSWNSPANGGPTSAFTCDGTPVPPGWEGVHVFDISNPLDPVVVAAVRTPCGSHTATGVPDLANNRLLVYNSSSSNVAACRGIDILQVPLDAPAAASYLRFESSEGRSCHDTGVILGDALLAGCAGGNGFTVWSLDPADGGSLEDPMFRYSMIPPSAPPVTVGHSLSFTWDGEVLIFGHEPGGGSQAECEATDPPDRRSYFFHNAETGAFLGKWTLPRPQTSTENCTLHNLNVVPINNNKRYVLVHGSYQSGTSVVDFTNPAAAFEVAFADPAPLVPPQLGGDWSSYWYDGFIYESDITRGLIIWNLSDSATAGAIKLDHLNPQTQEFTIDD